jgi:hypothetical protein
LTASAAPSNLGIRTGDVWLWGLVILLVLAYASPWITGPGASLSFGGYDLAEWTSLPPEVRSQNPPLVAAFMLRFPLAAITLYVGFAAAYRRFTTVWFMTLLVILALVAAQLPPAEFLTFARNDPNYGQQATLAVISGIIALLGMLLSPWRWRSVFAALFAAIGAVMVVAGLLSAQALLAAYSIGTDVSAAAWVTAAAFMLSAIYAAFRFVRSWALPAA